jgi:hypothetical protein
LRQQQNNFLQSADFCYYGQAGFLWFLLESLRMGLLLRETLAYQGIGAIAQVPSRRALVHMAGPGVG